MAEGNDDNKTEPATPYRRSEARKKGKVARSNDLAGAAVLLGAILVLWTTGPAIGQRLAQIVKENFALLRREDLDIASAALLLRHNILACMLPLAPAVLAMAAIAAVANFAQVGFLATPEVITPKLEKFDPASGAKKLMSVRSVATLVVSSLKVLAILLVGYFTVRSYLPALLSLSHAEPMTVAGTIFRAMLDVGLRISILLVILAALDYAYQRWQYERDLRMTKQEIKDEQKMIEGNPEVAARIRRMQHTLARRRMLADVKKADVVIRNPTHYAVALQYDPQKSAAPLVLAKGAGHLALKIIEIARKHNVPMVHEPPVARALYKNVNVGDIIPPQLYRAVAKILVHIFRLRGKKPAQQ